MMDTQEEILTDLTPLAQKNNISLQQDCEELGMVGSDALIYRLVFNLVENGIKYNRPGGAVQTKIDVSHMSRKEMEEMEKRVMRGEVITL